MTGIVTDLRPGGFGFIASDAYGRPWALIFRRGAAGDGGFDQETQPGDPSRSHALRVAPLD
jgi:hypothetical protein